MVKLPKIISQKTPMKKYQMTRKIDFKKWSVVFYYTQDVDITLLMALSTITAEQSKTTEFTMDTVEQFLDYCTIQSNKKIGIKFQQYLTSTLLHHTLILPKPRTVLQDTSALVGFQLNWLTPSLQFVAASAGKAKLCSLHQSQLHQSYWGKIISLIQEVMGHPQPLTPIYCDISTSTGIAINTVKI